MTPASIAAFITKRGESVTITQTGTPNNSATVSAHCRQILPNAVDMQAGNTGKDDLVVRVPVTAIDWTPARNDRAVIGGKTYTVQRVWTPKIGPDAAFYLLHVRN